MKALPLLLGAATAAGCASSRAPGGFDDDVDAARVDAASPDAATGPIDAPALAIDAPAAPTDAPAATGGTLLLSEIVLAPNEQELIEIVNPTGAAIALSTYYLSDAREYWRLPAGTPTLDASDFVVRFPAGASIPARGVVTVALDSAAAFTTALGAAPTYSVASASMIVVASSGVATLTNTGEPIVLFRWDGQADRVTDVDVMIAGAPTAANLLVDKSGVAQDGPDSGATASSYAADARTIPAQAATPASGRSTKRLALESAAVEVQAGGNGVGGQDETSEATGTTWDATFTTPTPGTVPAALAP